MARNSSYVARAKNKSVAKKQKAATKSDKTKVVDLSEREYYVPSNFASTTPCWDPSLEEDERWKYMVENVNSMRISQSSRYDMMRRYATIYEYGFRTNTTFSPRAKGSDDGVLMAGNRAFKSIRTAIADAFSQQVTVQVYTSGGTKKQRQMAEDATEGAQTILDENNFNQLEEEVCTDALAFSGTGFIKVWPDFANMCVRLTRTIPTDALIDDMDGRGRAPRSFFTRYLADKTVLAAHFDLPDLEGVEGSFDERQEALRNADPMFTYNQDETPLGRDNLAEVWELQHLPSRYVEQEGADNEDQEATGDGMKLVCVNGMTIQCLPHRKPYFDTVFYTPIPARVGTWGVPLMRFLAPIQRELEVLDMRIQRAVKKLGGVNIGIPRGAKINVRQLTNDSGTIFEYDGNQPPIEFNPTPMNPQVLQYRESLEGASVSAVGQNEMAATGSMPAGLTHVSGKAMYAALDTGSRVNAYILRERERRIPEILNRVFDAIAALVEYNPEFSTRYIKGSGYREVKWKEILDQRENLVLKCKPINALSTHPTARLGQATELLQNQAISNDEWREITRVGDVKANTDRKLAPMDIVECLLDDMCANGKYRSPEDFYNLQLCLEMGVQYYALAQVQGLDEDKQELLRRWIAETQFKITAATPPTPPVPPGMAGPDMMAGGPGAMPAPPPGPMM